MRDVILMALDKASRLSDEELDEEIRRFESGEQKLFIRDERDRKFPIHPIILATLKRARDDRRRIG